MKSRCLLFVFQMRLNGVCWRTIRKYQTMHEFDIDKSKKIKFCEALPCKDRLSKPSISANSVETTELWIWSCVRRVFWKLYTLAPRGSLCAFQVKWDLLTGSNRSNSVNFIKKYYGGLIGVSLWIVFVSPCEQYANNNFVIELQMRFLLPILAQIEGEAAVPLLPPICSDSRPLSSCRTTLSSLAMNKSSPKP